MDKHQELDPVIFGQISHLGWLDDMVFHDASLADEAIPHHFSKVVQRFPDKPAVVSGGQALTFKELDLISNRLAYAILDATGEGSTPVAILNEHNLYGIVAVIGALKAGKFYTSLDLSAPAERLFDLLKQSEAQLVITVSEQGFARSKSILEGLSVPVVNVESLRPDIADDTPPQITLSPDDRLALSFTSGSTGSPKGIIRTQRMLLHTVAANGNSYMITHRDNAAFLLAITTFSTKSPVFACLLRGAALHLYDFKKSGLAGISSWLSESNVTFFEVPPAVFRRMVNALPAGISFPHLRIVRLSGEAVTRYDVDLFKAHFPETCLLANGLGARETGGVTRYFISHNTQLDGLNVPVGYALPGKQIYILGEDGQILAPGEVGEIAVAAPHISTEYWHRPDLTENLYPTENRDLIKLGDLGSLREDGLLEFHGRKDFQVKIRGNRVDMAEVEQRLLEHPQVLEAVVSTYTDAQDETRLVAYIVTAGDVELTSMDVRKHLSQSLLDYMIPSKVITLGELPLTEGAKVNRRALPPPVETRSEASLNNYEPPSSELEKQLVAIWEKLLTISPVGIHDHFLDLGGDSLAAAEVVLHVEEMGYHITFADLAHTPNIHSLARMIETTNEGGPLHSLVALNATGTGLPLFCMHPAGGLVLIYHEMVKHLPEGLPVYGLQARGADGRSEVLTRIEDMAAYYITEICRVQPEGPYHLCGFSMGGKIALEMARQLRQQRQDVGAVIIIDIKTGITPWGHIATRFRWSLRNLNKLRLRGVNIIERNWQPFVQLPLSRRGKYLKQKVSSFRRAYKKSRQKIHRARAAPEEQTHFTPENQARWANHKASKDYTLKPYPGKIVHIRASQRVKEFRHPRVFWASLVDEVEVYTIQGTHQSIMEAKSSKALAAVITKVLGEVTEAAETQSKK